MCDTAAPDAALARPASRIADSGLFQGFILGVIVLNAITLGLQTYDISRRARVGCSRRSTTSSSAIFVVELAIRITAYGTPPAGLLPRRLERLRLQSSSRAAFVPGVRENVTLLRIVRLLRVVRLVTVLPDLRILVRAMARSIPPIMSLALLTLMLMYVYGMVGWILFGDEDPENWGDIGAGDALDRSRC